MLTALASSLVSYNAYRRVEARGDFVFLKLRDAPMWIVLPPGMMPQIAVDELRSKIASATP